MKSMNYEKGLIILFFVCLMVLMINIGYIEFNKTVLDSEKELEPNITVIKNTDNATDRLNLFSYPDNEMVYLTDNDMDVRYSWNISVIDEPTATPLIVTKNGGLIVVNAHKSIYKFDRNGNVEWYKDKKQWHNIAEINERGNLLTTYKKNRSVNGTEFLDQVIVEIDLSTGRIINEYSFYDIASKDIDILDKGIEGKFTEKFDPIHLNRIEIIRNDYSGINEADILFSARNINTVGIIGSERNNLKWYYREDLNVQHYPDIRDNGDVVVFNNIDSDSENSEILGVDRKENRSYTLVDYNDKEFFSAVMGSVQVLYNNNILVTSTRSGQSFEYDLDSDKVVWEVNLNSYKVYRLEKYHEACLEKVFRGSISSSTVCRI